jgi:cysteine desulfurase
LAIDRRKCAGAGGVIYLDYQATTPLAPEARAAMLPFLDTEYGNPHSPHRPGRKAAAAVEVARDQIMGALGDVPGRLIFTSGATEAANIAIQGVAASTTRRTILTIATEHACVRETVRAMAGRGFRVVELGVNRDGLVDIESARALIDGDTALVAAMLVNNEIGVIQPVRALANLAHAAGALFFCDAVQGFGRIEMPVDSCDMIAISSHKIHGPKGIGAMWLRDGVALPPLFHGGGQEGGLRSGTLAPMLCAGFGAAAQLAAERLKADAAQVERLWTRLSAPLLDTGWLLNGSASERWRGNLNMRRPGIDAGALISNLRALAFSAGSACASGSGKASHVLKALGLTGEEARSSIRLGFGRYTTEEEVDRAATMIVEAADRQAKWVA